MNVKLTAEQKIQVTYSGDLYKIMQQILLRENKFRRAQEHFWNAEVSVEMIMSRLPDCQRRLVLEQSPADEVEVELYSNGDNVWTLRSGKQSWQIDTQTCTQYAEAKGDPGELVGVFRDENGKLAFAAAVAVPATPGGAEAPAVAVPGQAQEAAPPAQ